VRPARRTLRACLLAQARAAALAARIEAAVARDHHARLHLVALALEPREEAAHALPAGPVAVEHEVLVVGRQLLERQVARHAAARARREQARLEAPARRCRERRHRARRQAPARIRHDPIARQPRGPPEALAGGTRARRTVEREERRSRRSEAAAAAVAGEALAVARAVAVLADHHAAPVGEPERGGDRFGEPPVRASAGRQGHAIHQQQAVAAQGVERLHRDLGGVVHGAARVEDARVAVAHEPIAQVGGLLARSRRQRRADLHARAGEAIRRALCHRRGGAGEDLQVAGGAPRLPGVRVEQAQVVEDLGRGAHRRARVGDAVSPLDRDRRRQLRHQVDIGPRQALEELARVGGERGDVAALALGVQRVEGERGLPRARHAGHHGERAQRDPARHARQVVGARVHDRDVGHLGGEAEALRDRRRAAPPALRR
jgi:hypothetical protein